MIELKYTSPLAAGFYEGHADPARPWVGPSYGSPDAGAFDLRACIERQIVIMPGEQYSIGTGIALNMQPYRENNPYADFFRIAAVILPRSGRGSKEGLCIANTIGLIDEDFQGEITFCAWARPTKGDLNLTRGKVSGCPIVINPGERIGQLMFMPALRPDFKIVPEFSSKTDRGAGGYGSTGNS